MKQARPLQLHKAVSARPMTISDDKHNIGIGISSKDAGLTEWLSAKTRISACEMDVTPTIEGKWAQIVDRDKPIGKTSFHPCTGVELNS